MTGEWERLRYTVILERSDRIRKGSVRDKGSGRILAKVGAKIYFWQKI